MPPRLRERAMLGRYAYGRREFARSRFVFRVNRMRP